MQIRNRLNSKFGKKKKISVAVGLAVALGCVNGARAQAADDGGDRIQEILVSAPFEQSVAEDALAADILVGEELRRRIGGNLGDTLKSQIGVANDSFGTGVGRPIIRGQSANRVKILQDGVGVHDAAIVSPDHPHAVNLALAERLEVLRGPAALLYGSGAIGGVVNVIDNRIPENMPEQAAFIIQQSHNTVSSQDETTLRIDGGAGNVAFHIGAFTSKNGNFEIDGYAIDEAAIEAEEELILEHLGEEHHDEEHHEDEHHEDEHHDDEHGAEELENTLGYIGNSDGESRGGNLGFSFVGDNGFFGFSVSEVDRDTGLPLGVHTHAHGEEEHHDEDEHHDEEEHHEDDHDEGHDEHAEEVEFVRIDMEKTRYDLKSEYRPDSGLVESIRGEIGFSEYFHDEVEYFADGGREVGTRYSNDGTEGHFTLTHVPIANWSGVVGLQFSDSKFSAIGEEAFIPQSDVNSVALFAVERYVAGNWTGEIGLRFEDNSVDPDGGCVSNNDTANISGRLLYNLDDDSNLALSASRSQRAPTVEELYSNISMASCAREDDDELLVLHAATNLLEIGDPTLEEESAANLELGYRRFGDNINIELNAYYNQIDDFIFLDLTSEEFEEQRIAQYRARDARFVGVEGEVSFPLMDMGSSSLELGLFGDLVNAEFDSGGNVPRIPAAKLGADLDWRGDAWSANLRLVRVQEQDDVAELELPMNAYTLLSFYADYQWGMGADSELSVFLRGENLLDEEIRNHASLLKNYAPDPGRGFLIGVRFEY